MNQTREEQDPKELNVGELFVHTAYASLGFFAGSSLLTAFLALVPIVSSHLRLEEPWPKITTLGGAVIALFFLKLPVEIVVLIFVLGVYVGTAVRNEMSFWKLYVHVIGIASVLFAGMVGLNASLVNKPIFTYWSDMIATLTEKMKSVQGFSDFVNVENFQAVLTLQGPFLYLWGVSLCVWIGLGVVAHLKMTPAEHPYSSDGLRKLRLSTQWSYVFGALFLARYLPDHPAKLVLNGLFLLIGATMLVSGSVCLSNMLFRRQVQQFARTLIYSIAVTVGSYALMGLGVLGPWIYARIEAANSQTEARK